MQSDRTWNAAYVSQMFRLKPATLSLWVRNGYIDGIKPVGKGKVLSFDVNALLWLGVLLEFHRLGFAVDRAARLVRRLRKSTGDLTDLRITMRIQPAGEKAEDLTIFDAQRYLASRRAPQELQQALAR